LLAEECACPCAYESLAVIDPLMASVAAACFSCNVGMMYRAMEKNMAPAPTNRIKPRPLPSPNACTSTPLSMTQVSRATSGPAVASSNSWRRMVEMGDDCRHMKHATPNMNGERTIQVDQRRSGGRLSEEMTKLPAIIPSIHT